jgi:hypothetical protein
MSYSTTVGVVVASVAVVITLAFLIYEVRQNTFAIERQTVLDRQSRLVDPYLTSPDFRAVYTKIKAKDGRELRVEALIDRYELTDEEAVLWVRHLDENWTGMEADFLQYGPSRGLDALIIGFLTFPDAKAYWEASLNDGPFSPAFVEHVESLRQAE